MHLVIRGISTPPDKLMVIAVQMKMGIIFSILGSTIKANVDLIASTGDYDLKLVSVLLEFDPDYVSIISLIVPESLTTFY